MCTALVGKPVGGMIPYDLLFYAVVIYYDRSSILLMIEVVLISLKYFRSIASGKQKRQRGGESYCDELCRKLNCLVYRRGNTNGQHYSIRRLCHGWSMNQDSLRRRIQKPRA